MWIVKFPTALLNVHTYPDVVYPRSANLAYGNSPAQAQARSGARYHSVMDDKEINQIREAAYRVLGATPVVFAYLYGSRAVGNERPDSDLDVAVYFDDSVPEDHYLDQSLTIASLLAEAGLSGAEVVVLNSAPLALIGRIIKQRKVIYSRDEPVRVTFESLKFREFLDFDFHARQLDSQFLKDMAEGRR